MTKKIILPLAALILLSACAGKFGLQKRRYTKGYYLSVSKHTSTPKKSVETPVLTAKHEPVKTQKVNPAPDNTIYNTTSEIIPVVKQEVPATKIEVPKTTATVKHLPVLTASVKKQVTEQAHAFKNLVSVAKKQQKKSGGDSDANTVVLVIFSFFPILSLIAMYIHDGHRITLNFWIDLLLYLTFIGYIIYALLVVLDVVDLSK